MVRMIYPPVMVLPFFIILILIFLILTLWLLFERVNTLVLLILSNFVSYYNLSSSYSVFYFFCGLVHSFQLCIRSPFYLSMERCNLRGNDDFITEWNVGPYLSSFKEATVGCQWVYNVKLNLDRSLARLKAWLAAKEYSQVYGVDYQNMFSPIAKIGTSGYLSHWLQLIIGLRVN